MHEGNSHCRSRGVRLQPDKILNYCTITPSRIFQNLQEVPTDDQSETTQPADSLPAIQAPDADENSQNPNTQDALSIRATSPDTTQMDTNEVIDSKSSYHSGLYQIATSRFSIIRSKVEKLATGLNPFKKLVVKEKIKTAQPNSFQNGKQDS